MTTRWRHAEGATPLVTGVYVLGNDGVIEFLIYLVGSMRLFTPTIPAYLIPCNGVLGQTQLLLEEYSVTL